MEQLQTEREINQLQNGQELAATRSKKLKSREANITRMKNLYIAGTMSAFDCVSSLSHQNMY